MILAWCYCFIEKDFKFQITNWRFDRNLGETYFRIFFEKTASSFSRKKSFFHTKIKLSTNNIFSQKIITKVTHLGRYLSRKLFYVSFCISTSTLFDQPETEINWLWFTFFRFKANCQQTAEENKKLDKKLVSSSKADNLLP